jgi:hypothetical protein
MTKLITAVVATTVVLLTGCADVSESSPTITTPPLDGGIYSGADAVRDAYTAAGGQCSGYKAGTVASANWATGASCQGDKTIVTFVNDVQRDAFLNRKEHLYGDQSEPLLALYGKNWAVIASDAAMAHPSMGGSLRPMNPAAEEAVKSASRAREAAAAESAAQRWAADRPKPPADGGTYASLADLRDAYVQAGGECPDLDQTNKVRRSAESGVCTDDRILSTYLTSDDLAYVVNNVKGLYQGTNTEGSGGTWLVGKNWILNVPDSKAMRWKLGGQLVSF